MNLRLQSGNSELTALLIAPDRALAAELLAALTHDAGFQVLAELKSYPSAHTVEIRLRQMQPDLILLDVGSDWEAASGVISSTAESDSAVQIVALHRTNDSEVLLRCLRLGASEFLHAPFDAESLRQAAGRLLRLRQPDEVPAPKPGTIVVFSSAKPGSGATTLTLQTACAIRRITGKKVLLADFDLMGGSVAFHSNLSSQPSRSAAAHRSGAIDPATWPSMISDLHGVDVLPAPDVPYEGQLDNQGLNAVLEYARLNYDWVLIDLPAVFERLSLIVLSNADKALIVSTAELPSLHLARKAVQLLQRLGLPKERFQVLVNRVNRGDDIWGTDMQKVLNVAICSKIPNDYPSLNRCVTLGDPLDPDCDLGRSIDELARSIAS